MRILVVEDDEVLANGLKVGLQLAGLTVDTVGTVKDADLAIDVDSFDAVVLDLMLPDGSGVDVLKKMREAQDKTPVLLLTAKDEVADRIAGLDAGADDYLGKPFDLDEVAARLRAITRRADGRSSAELSHNGLCLEPAKMLATKDGSLISLSPREFAILQALMSAPGVIMSKATLEQKLYGWQEDVESNTVEVHIHKLRAKIGPSYIETIRGVGYRLRAE